MPRHAPVPATPGHDRPAVSLPAATRGQVSYDVDGVVAHVTLRNPARLNAMSRAMWRELRGAFERAHADATLRCVVLRGEASHFCSGGDISEYPAFRFDLNALRAFHEDDVWGGLQAMLDCDVPVIACIEGSCMGAGVEMAACCDLRLATTDARFGAPIGRLGFPMAPRELQVVAREAGLSTARQLLLEGALLEAGELLARGFVHHICDSAEIYGLMQGAVQRVCALAPEAARLNKQTLRALAAGPEAFEALCRDAYAYAASDEHREGVESFLAKRKAAFSLLPSKTTTTP